MATANPMGEVVQIPASLRFVRPPGLPVTCSDEQLLEAVKAYLCGAREDVLAPMLSVPEHAVKYWTDSREWGELTRYVLPEVRGILSGQLTRCASKALLELDERITDGDYRYDAGGALLGRTKLRAKELSLIATQVMEQSERLEKLLGNLKDSDDSLTLQELANALETIARKPKDISGEAERVAD